MPGTRVRPSAGPSVNLVPGIHVFATKQGVDGRDKPGHDAWDYKLLAISNFMISLVPA
jgi:hypothetical protein